jgi:hypothetical protein
MLGGGQGKWALWQFCPTTEESLKNALFSVKNGRPLYMGHTQISLQAAAILSLNFGN